MLVPVKQIESDGLHLAGTIAAPAAAASGDLALPAPLAFSLRLARDKQRVTVTGWLHTTARIGCSRCLTPIPYSVDREFELALVPRDQAPDEAVTELDASDLDVDYYAEDALDLAALLVEQVNLDLPMKQLCSDDCRGLCPQCGTNRNDAECDCEPVRDSRLSPLAELGDRT